MILIFIFLMIHMMVYRGLFFLCGDFNSRCCHEADFIQDVKIRSFLFVPIHYIYKVMYSPFIL